MVETDEPGHRAGALDRPVVAGAARATAGLLVLWALGVGASTLLAGPAGTWRPVEALGVQDAVSAVPGLLGVVREVVGLGSPVAAAVVLGLVGSALLLHGRRDLAGYVALTGVGALVLGVGVGAAAVAAGPEPRALGPDGYTLSAAVAYGLLLVIVGPAVPGRWRRGAAAAVVALVVLVGFTRIALGERLVPVLSGAVLGGAWLVVSTAAFGHRGRLARAGPYRPAEAGRAPAPPHPWRRSGGLAATWLLLLGVVVGAGALVTGSAAVQRLDAAVTGWFVMIRTPSVTAVAEVFSALGDTPTIVAGALALAVLTTVATRSARPVVLIVLVLAGELALFLASSTVIARPRPDVGHLGLLLPPTSSFPSGHVSAAVCLYGLAALLVAGASAPGRRWVPVGVAVVLVVGVAAGRLYFGVHHPTDAVASVLFAVPWLLACARLGPPVAVRPG